ERCEGRAVFGIGPGRDVPVGIGELRVAGGEAGTDGVLASERDERGDVEMMWPAAHWAGVRTRGPEVLEVGGRVAVETVEAPEIAGIRREGRTVRDGMIGRPFGGPLQRAAEVRLVEA